MASSRSKSSVRMGPISIFSLIILLSLAVLAVLAISTAQATYSSAEKQARFTTDTYVNEIEAQGLVALVDGELSVVRKNDGGIEEALTALKRTLPDEAWIEDNTVRAEFIQESGRTLRVTLTITKDADYRVTQWQSTTQWSTDNNDTLWQG